MAGLTWYDIDLAQRTILLKRETSKTAREWMIPINSELSPYLEHLFLQTQKSSPYKEINNDQVFRIELFNPNRKPLAPVRISQWFNNLKRDIGKDYAVSAHKLRHTFATTLANLNKDNGITTELKVLQNLLGHTSFTTTLNYVHPSMKMMNRLVNQLSIFNQDNLDND